jgi:Putative amidoligase enzyme
MRSAHSSPEHGFYAPPPQLFEHYLEHNPTRNRPLDLLPLFVHLHGPGLLKRVEDAPLVKPRPTFHYRLPNCELTNPGWTPRAYAGESGVLDPPAWGTGSSASTHRFQGSKARCSWS